MSDPKRASDTPYPVEVESGKSYFWCACGRSNNQPFCDGSHKVTSFEPVEVTPDESRTVFFCGCKNSGNKPFCDGTHNGL